MSITGRLTNLNTLTVIAIVAILVVLKIVLTRRRFAYAKTIAEIVESVALAIGLVFLLIRPFLAQAFYIPSESMVPTLMVNDHIIVNKLVYRFCEPRLGDVVVFKSPKSAGHNEADYIKRVIGMPGDRVRMTAGYVLIGNIPYYHDDLRVTLAAKENNGENCAVKLENGNILVNDKPISKSEVAAACGKPGAKVKVFPGKVYLNDRPLGEDYTAEDTDCPYPNELTPKQWLNVDKGGVQVVKIPRGCLLVMGDNRNFSDDSRHWGLLDRTRVCGKAMFIFWPLSRIRWVR